MNPTASFSLVTAIAYSLICRPGSPLHALIVSHFAKNIAWSHRETGLFPGSPASVPGLIKPPTWRRAWFHPYYGWCFWSVLASQPCHGSRGMISTLSDLIFWALVLGVSAGGWGCRLSVHFPPSSLLRRAMTLTPSCIQSIPSHSPDWRAIFSLFPDSPVWRFWVCHFIHRLRC